MGLEVRENELVALSAERLLPCLCSLTDWSLCAMAWSLPTLDPQRVHMQFESSLRKEVRRRGFTAEDVERSAAGSHCWMTRQ